MYTNTILMATLLTQEEYSNMELIQTYVEPEPRFSMSYMLNEQSSVKRFLFSETHNIFICYQLPHLISNRCVDASSSLIVPEKANQYSVGYFRNFLNNTFESSVELYYKDMYDLVDYKDGADVLLNEHVEADLAFGIGRSYGIELLLKKATWKIYRMGWIYSIKNRTQI